jgi:hypothetical protein
MKCDWGTVAIGLRQVMKTIPRYYHVRKSWRVNTTSPSTLPERFAGEK